MFGLCDLKYHCQDGRVQVSMGLDVVSNIVKGLDKQFLARASLLGVE